MCPNHQSIIKALLRQAAQIGVFGMSAGKISSTLNVIKENTNSDTRTVCGLKLNLGLWIQ